MEEVIGEVFGARESRRESDRPGTRGKEPKKIKKEGKNRVFRGELENVSENI